jgi:hypothetical protein
LVGQLRATDEWCRGLASGRTLRADLVKLEPETIVCGLVRLVHASPAGLEGVQVTDLEFGVTAAAVDGIELELLGRLVVDVRDWAAGGFAGPDLALRGTIRDGDGRHVVCGFARVVWCADWCFYLVEKDQS